MILDITPKAKKYLIEVLKKADKQYVKFGVRGGGCAGFNYTWNVCDIAEATDMIYRLNPYYDHFNIYALLVDPSIEYIIKNSTIDIENDPFLTGYRMIVDNPNAEGSCGCGESFTLKTTSA